MKNVLASILIVILTGCVAVPSTTLSFGNFKYKSPKDADIGSLDITVNTNGTVHIKASKVNATNNPDVINSSAQGQVDIINAVGAQVGNAAAMAVKAAK